VALLQAKCGLRPTLAAKMVVNHSLLTTFLVFSFSALTFHDFHSLGGDRPFALLTRGRLDTMRLINSKTLLFEEHFDPDVPPYAILSHTWGPRDQEVTYQDYTDILRGDKSAKGKAGYAKIVETCRLARRRNLGLVWIDTCCIDKSSSAELAESINSMFKWYQESRTCFVYLEDLEPGGNMNEDLGKCRWFTRGWTLQELLAPSSLSFYDNTWTKRGRKRDYLSQISAITHIDEDVLAGTVTLEECSLGERMYWAANRRTTRVEDIAYCLLGIFDVNLPLIYGEGPKAFRRLQEEIIKQTDDMTIFSWQRPHPKTFPEWGLQVGDDLLASSPADFTRQKFPRDIEPDGTLRFAFTNTALRIRAPLFFTSKGSPEAAEKGAYFFLTGMKDLESDEWIGVPLTKVGPDSFARCRNATLIRTSLGSLSFEVRMREIFIFSEARRVRLWSGSSITFSPSPSLEVEGGTPQSHWDEVNNRAFAPFSTSEACAFKVRQKVNNDEFGLVVMFREGIGAPMSLRMFVEADHPKLSRFLFRLSYETQILWEDLRNDFDAVLGFNDTVRVVSNGTPYVLTATFTLNGTEGTGVLAERHHSVEIGVAMDSGGQWLKGP